MADPVVYDSQLSKLFIKDTGGDEREVTDYLVGISGLPGPRDLNDATTLNRAGRHWHPTLENVVFNLELVWSQDALVGSDTVFGPLRQHTATVAFNYGPHGNTATFVKYSGNCWVRNYPIETRVGALVTCRVELQVQGTVSRGTY